VTFRAFQSATSFGALDKAAIADGASLGAMQARTMARQANRLLKKRHQVLNLMWPITTTTIDDYSQYAAEFIAQVDATIMVPPVPCFKKPGITSGTVYIRSRSPNGVALSLRAGTLAVDHDTVQRTDVTGTGAWQWVSIPVTLDAGHQERLVIYLRAEGADGALMDTGTWGSPNTGGIDEDDLLTDIDLEERSSPSTQWDPELAGEGHVIVFYARGERVAERKITSITDHSGHQGITFEALTFPELYQLQSQKHITGAVTYEIRAYPWIALAQVLLVTDERSF
jgi:hypothetical protein